MCCAVMRMSVDASLRLEFENRLGNGLVFEKNRLV
jgi:hypothetical protein